MIAGSEDASTIAAPDDGQRTPWRRKKSRGSERRRHEACIYAAARRRLPARAAGDEQRRDGEEDEQAEDEFGEAGQERIAQRTLPDAPGDDTVDLRHKPALIHQAADHAHLVK